MLINDLEILLGKQAADVFIQTFGGQTIWIPTLKPGSRPSTYRKKIIAAIGSAPTAKLSKAYGGDYMQVPNGRQSDPRSARQKIAEMQREGASVNEMVKIAGRSRRTIYRWLNLPHAKVYGEKNAHNHD